MVRKLKFYDILVERKQLNFYKAKTIKQEAEDGITNVLQHSKLEIILRCFDLWVILQLIINDVTIASFINVCIF